MGLSFIFITVYLFKRLPQSDIIRKLSIVLFLVTFLSGISLLFLYLNEIYSGQSLRAEIINLNTEFNKLPRLTISDCDITLKHNGNKIQSTTKLVISNKTQNPSEKLVLSLNPGLAVADISSEGENLNFKREIHLIIVDLKKPLQPGESKSITLNYEGGVDDNINYPDINDNLREKLFNLAFYAVDKKYSILRKDYVLLTSENLWYPQSRCYFYTGSTIHK